MTKPDPNKPDLNKRLRKWRKDQGWLEVRNIFVKTEEERQALKKKYPTPILPRDYEER